MLKEPVRILAAAAWASGGYNKALALERFQEMMQNAGLPMPKCPEKAIKRWGEQLKKQQNVRGGQHRSGRKPKLSSEQVNQLIKQLLGWREAGLTAPYASIARFCVDNPIAKQIKAASGAGTKTVYRQLKAEIPSLGHAKLTVKTQLTQDQKNARIAACRRLERKPLRDLEWVVWVDAKTLYVNLKHRHGWIDRASATPEDHVLQHRLAGRITSSTVQIRYCAAVNAKVGQVTLHFITGTTGMSAQRDGKNYKVRA